MWTPLAPMQGCPLEVWGIFRIKRWDAHFQRFSAAPGAVKLLEYSSLIQPSLREGLQVASAVPCLEQAILLSCESCLEITISQRNSDSFHSGVALLGDASSFPGAKCLSWPLALHCN